MSIGVILLVILIAYTLGLVLAPFPYWPTYFILWRSVCCGPWPWRTRYRQAIFLLKAGATAPLRTFFWYLDELLYPGYRQRNVNPVFIIGQPRCGTTLLHRTLASDTQTFFAVRHMEWRYPFISMQKLIKALRLENWLGRLNYWPQTTEAGRLAAKMHSNTLADWEEDGIFFEENFLHHFFIFLRFPDPALLPYLNSFEELPPRVQQHMLDIHRKVIQKVHYLRGPESRIFLSKEVTSHNKIPALLKLYPESRFIVITREASSFMASLQALVQTSTEVKTGVNPATIPQWKEAFIQRMREDSQRLADLCRLTIPHERQFRVSSTHFMQHVSAAVAPLYKKLHLSIAPGFATYLAQLDNETKKRDRGYSYDALNLKGFEDYDTFVGEIVAQYQETPTTPSGGAS